jgi:hypothetical protein
MGMDNDEQGEELVDIDQLEFADRYSMIAKYMETNEKWYKLEGIYKGMPNKDYNKVNFVLINEPKILALGRSSYYDRFIKDLEMSDGIHAFQSDYMVWIDPSNPYLSLQFYINTAEVIHFNLEGLSIEDIKSAIMLNRKTVNRADQKTPYMTIWELNQIAYSDNIFKAIWHINGNIKGNDVYSLFDNKETPFGLTWDSRHENRFVLNPV